jgi:hypothetical protein
VFSGVKSNYRFHILSLGHLFYFIFFRVFVPTFTPAIAEPGLFSLENGDPIAENKAERFSAAAIISKQSKKSIQ